MRALVVVAVNEQDRQGKRVTKTCNGVTHESTVKVGPRLRVTGLSSLESN